MKAKLLPMAFNNSQTFRILELFSHNKLKNKKKIQIIDKQWRVKTERICLQLRSLSKLRKGIYDGIDHPAIEVINSPIHNTRILICIQRYRPFQLCRLLDQSHPSSDFHDRLAADLSCLQYHIPPKSLIDKYMKKTLNIFCQYQVPLDY